MPEKFYRGYILARLAKIGSEWNVCEKMDALKDPNNSWIITYSTPIFGSWDLLIEVSFKKLEDLDLVVTRLRSDEELRDNLEETTTFVSSRPNYPPDNC